MSLLAANFEDPEHARIIYLAAGGLVLIAVLIIAGTVWWWRSAAVEHPSLGPLEVMGTKSWWNNDHRGRQEVLDAVRPAGAELGDDSLIVPDPVDLLEQDRTRPLDFDDLLEDPELDDWRSDDRRILPPRADIRRDPPRVTDPEDDELAGDDLRGEDPRGEDLRDEDLRTDIRRVRRPEPRPVKRAPRVPMDPLLQRQSDDY